MKIWSSHSDYDDCLDYYTKQPKKNINLLKKSLFTLINNISNSKGIKKDFSIIDNTKDLLNYIERKIIWT